MTVLWGGPSPPVSSLPFCGHGLGLVPSQVHALFPGTTPNGSLSRSDAGFQTPTRIGALPPRHLGLEIQPLQVSVSSPAQRGFGEISEVL